jgi:hypothetical protein
VARRSVFRGLGVGLRFVVVGFASRLIVSHQTERLLLSRRFCASIYLLLLYGYYFYIHPVYIGPI